MNKYLKLIIFALVAVLISNRANAQCASIDITSSNTDLTRPYTPTTDQTFYLIDNATGSIVETSTTGIFNTGTYDSYYSIYVFYNSSSDPATNAGIPVSTPLTDFSVLTTTTAGCWDLDYIGNWQCTACQNICINTSADATLNQMASNPNTDPENTNVYVLLSNGSIVNSNSTGDFTADVQDHIDSLLVANPDLTSISFQLHLLNYVSTDPAPSLLVGAAPNLSMLSCYNGDFESDYVCYTFSLNQTTRDTLFICEGSAVTINSITYSPSADTSVTNVYQNLALCDSTVITRVRLKPTYSNTVNLTSCDPADVGTVTNTYTALNGCDSIVTTITTLLPSYANTVNLTSCDPADVGTVTNTYTALNGCDSIVTTITTLLPSYANTVNLTSCDPADVGTVTNIYTALNGCDSIVTTITTLLPSYANTVNLTSCDPADVGTVTNTYTALNGCDSIVTTITTLLPSYTNTVNLTSCDPADVGTVTNTYTALNGCDSVVTTITTLISGFTNTVNLTSCDPADVGTVTNTYTASNGCDSVVTTITTLISGYTNTVNLTSCDPADVGTVTNTFTAANGCDSVVTTITTLISGFTNTVNLTSCDPADVGTFTNTYIASNGCDSTVTTITTLVSSYDVTVDYTSCNPTDTGTVVTVLTSSTGCDSTVTAHTSLLPTITTDVDLVSCNPADTGRIVTVFTAFNGCDSLVNFHTTLIVCTGTATTTGNVYYDTNDNDTYDTGSDVMLPGVSVELWNDNGTPADTTDDYLVDIQLTDINGQFIFTGLAPTGSSATTGQYYYVFPTSIDVTVSGTNFNGPITTGTYGVGAANPASNAFDVAAGVTANPDVFAGYYQTINSVDFVNFISTADCEKVTLAWTVGVESQTMEYRIEKSTDGLLWSPIGTVAAIGTTSLHTYSYTDLSKAVEKTYYRIVEVEHSGVQSLSSINMVRSDCVDDFIISLYPNPSSHNLNYEIMSPEDKDVVVEIVDVVGRVHLSEQIHLNKGKNNFTINIEKLAQDIYFTGIYGMGQGYYMKFTKIE